MKAEQWEIEGLAEERKRRAARKKNDAFRLQLEIRKAEELAAARTRLKLKAAACAAGLSWTLAAIRLLH